MLGNNATVTIWNRLHIDRKEEFIRTVIPVKCKYLLEVKSQSSGAGAGMSATIYNVHKLNIPWSENYKPFSEWQSMTAEERKGFFTLSPEDIIALGERDDEITGENPNRLPDVLGRLSPHVFTIKAIQDNTRAALGKHWHIVGI